MKDTTAKIILTVLEVDETVTKSQRSRILSACDGQEDSLMTRAEVAARFKVTPSAVDRWRRIGRLRAVLSPGGRRVLGFDRVEVMKPGQFGISKTPVDWDHIDSSSQAFFDCIRIATEIEHGTFTPLGNWTHFYNPEKANPEWGKLLLDSNAIGMHIFGRLAGEYERKATA